jgi:predicted Zn-ribbon and HTH transcriptional regulator
MNTNTEIIKKAISGVLNIIDQEREKEIISRRFGLSGKKETLESIGEMLNITRERVRQLEKAILIRLRLGVEDNKVPELVAAEKIIVRNLAEMGRVARISNLATKIFGHEPSPAELAEVAFLVNLSPALTFIDDNDFYYLSAAIADYGNAKFIRSKADEIVSVIKKNKTPMTLDELDTALSYEHPSQISAVASISKLLSTLNGLWGLAKDPTVNPRNIRDKIFVVLENKKEPMHFSEIAKAISESSFKRRDVTVQAIHNELIKDSRFVLIGRGVYALSSWGYKKGTVAEAIADVLSKSSEPMFRNDIVREVLRARRVKETTILLNLQNRELFERVGKNNYRLIKK